MDQAPPMGDRSRWQSIIYQSIWLGEEPQWTAEERKAIAKNRVTDVNSRMGAAPSNREMDQVKALMERAASLRASRDQEGSDN